MVRNVRTNPLALAVLSCLYERPMHPYEISQTLRTRAKEDSIRLNYGSLYGVVASLERRGLITAVETVREGRRPERTVYDITEAGKVEMTEWLSELLAVPVKEYLQYEAGLSLIGGVTPAEAVGLLRQRVATLEMRLAQLEAVSASALKQGLPRLYLLESEYTAALLRAELDFTAELVRDIESGALAGLDDWRSWYADASAPHPPEEHT
ncbi:MAG TPA: PadR family transcriptional regulator [Acidimicrobiales bacterium]